MKYTIEDLRKGKCAVINDGTLEELRDVLSLAFPDDVASLKEWYNRYPCDKLFFAINNGREWYSEKETDLPTQSVKYFIENFKKDIKDSILKSRKSLEDKIKELKELAKSQGMECDVVLSEKKKKDHTVVFDGFETGYHPNLATISFIVNNLYNKEVYYDLALVMKKYLDENH